jgi:hypothetical protein
VLQSIGRGVRIQPLPNKKGRLIKMYNGGEIDEELMSKIYNQVSPLETLFIYGTKADNLQEVINTLKQESEKENTTYLFEIDQELLDKPLLALAYKKNNNATPVKEENKTSEYVISQQDYEIIKTYLQELDDIILICKYDVDPLTLKKVKEEIAKGPNNSNLLRIDNTTKIVKNPDILLRNLFNFFNAKLKESNRFKELYT